MGLHFIAAPCQRLTSPQDSDRRLVWELYKIKTPPPRSINQNPRRPKVNDGDEFFSRFPFVVSNGN